MKTFATHRGCTRTHDDAMDGRFDDVWDDEEDEEDVASGASKVLTSENVLLPRKVLRNETAFLPCRSIASPALK